MKKFEYKEIEIKDNVSRVEFLNKEGEEGWILIIFLRKSEFLYYGIMMREIVK